MLSFGEYGSNWNKRVIEIYDDRVNAIKAIVLISQHSLPFPRFGGDFYMDQQIAKSLQDAVSARLYSLLCKALI